MTIESTKLKIPLHKWDWSSHAVFQQCCGTVCLSTTISPSGFRTATAYVILILHHDAFHNRLSADTRMISYIVLLSVSIRKKVEILANLQPVIFLCNYLLISVFLVELINTTASLVQLSAGRCRTDGTWSRSLRGYLRLVEPVTNVLPQLQVTVA